MWAFLKNHPFAVAAFFESSLVLTYAVPKEELESMIPECLSLDTFEGKWAFVAVAMVNTKNLRPKGFPVFLGNDFLLTGYRIFVRYTTSEGKRLRGLFILKSETNKKKMERLGNIFTHYHYTTTDIDYNKSGSMVSVKSVQSGLDITVDVTGDNRLLPKDSPFHDWKDARRFAGPLPFTFTFNDKTSEVLIIEGVRQHWEPKPVSIVKNKIGFVDKLGLKGIVLANAFIIQDIPYYWKKGRTDLWKRQ